MSKIRNSARDEDCLMRLPGVCSGDPSHTIASHYRGSAGGKGMSLKSSDFAICYSCTWCDKVYDGQAPRPEWMSKEYVDLAWHEGHLRTLLRLVEKGLIK